MVDPFVTGMLVWLAKEIASRGIGLLFDRAAGTAVATVSPAAPGLPAVRRYDLSGGAAVTSDADVTVRFTAGAGQRLPVVLAVQDAAERTGDPFPMVLTDTAHLTLRRGAYLMTALVLRLPEEAGALPVLRGVGWQRPWIAGNAVERVGITTSAPTKKMVRKLGLVGPDGAALFTLAPPEPLHAPLPPTADPFRFRTRPSPVDRPRFVGPVAPVDRPRFVGPVTPEERPRFVRPVTPDPFAAFTALSRARVGDTCRALDDTTGSRCTKATDSDLCTIHRVRVMTGGRPVHWYDTGEQVPRSAL